MTSEVFESPILAYQIIDEIGTSGMDFSTLICKPEILERYENDTNKITTEIQKLITFGIITLKKTYDAGEGVELRFNLTKRGLGILNNPLHE